jgi:4'-phosphopantetheinyl transferase
MSYDSSRESYWASLLSDEETVRLSGMKHEKRRRSFLLGRATLRLLLSELTDRPPDSVSIVVEENGSLAAPDTSYTISIAHSGDRAVAVASERPVGIDLEIATVKDDDLLKYILHEDELPRVGALTISESEKLFLCWTAKEAVLKALGTGLRRSPKSVQVSQIDRNFEFVVIHDLEGSLWHVRIERDGPYYLSLAVPDP